MILLNRQTLQQPAFILAVGILAYCVGFIVLTFWKYDHFYYDNLDLAIFNNVFFNTMQGRIFEASIHAPSYLIDHFSPIILLLTPLYALAPGPKFLLVLETLFFGFCAWPVYLCAREMLGYARRRVALFIALLWLVNPLVHNANFYEAHLVPIAIFFLFWCAYFYLTEKKSMFVAGSLLALMVREDIALILIFFSALALIDRKKLFWILYPIFAGSLWFLMSFLVISAVSPTGSYKFIIFYSWLGGTDLISVIISFIRHPVRVLMHFFTWGNLEFILGISFPFFFIVFWRSKYAFLLLPPMAQILLAANGGGALILFTHYGSFLLVGLFLIFSAAVARIESGRYPKLLPSILHKRKPLYGIIACAAVYGAATYGSIVPVARAWNTDNQSLAKQKLLNLVPAHSPVLATYELLTPLSTRRKIYSFHYAYIGTTQYAEFQYTLPENTEYLAIDWQDVLKAQMHFKKHHTWGAVAHRLPENLSSILRQFHPVFFDGSVSLWKKGDAPSGGLPGIFSFSEISRVSEDDRPQIISVENSQNGVALLSIAIPNGVFPKKEYYLAIKTTTRTFELPFGYGQLDPLQMRRAGTVMMAVHVAADERIERVHLYEWDQGFLVLGKLKNLAIKSDAVVIDSFTVTTEEYRES